LNPSYNVLDIVADPLALVGRTGDTLAANTAFERLAEACGPDSGLVELFGPAAKSLLSAADEGGGVRVPLQLVSGPAPRRWYYVSLRPDPEERGHFVLLTDATEEIMWRHERQRHDQDLVVLKDLGTLLSGTIEVDELTAKIFQQTSRLVASPNFYIALYDRDNQVVSFPRYIEDGLWQNMTSRPFSNGLTEYLLRTGEPLLLARDVAEQAHERGIEPLGRPSLAWMGVPLVANGETIGVLAVQDYQQSDCYGPHDLEMLGIIAAQAAGAIRSARLLAAARRAYLELSEVQAKLLESERIRGVTEAVGSMNHEVNNPLAAIAGNAQLLLRRAEALTPEVRSKVETILDAARRIQQVTAKMATLVQATARPYSSDSPLVELNRATPREVALSERSFFPSIFDPHVNRDTDA
jgi:GAF domain-containing protein